MAVQLNMAFQWVRQPGMDVALMVLIIGLWPVVICEEDLCNNNQVIKGGWIKWPENRVERSVMTYICPDGFRPYPVSWRYCSRDGKWSHLRNVYGERAQEASCKEVTCLAPQLFEFGILNPQKTIYKVNESINFRCFDGFQLIGSSSTTCLPNGQWSGKVPRCNTIGTFCPNPGIPFGSKRIGNSFDVFSVVQYHCGRNILRGSLRRKCLESGEWSGVEPRCESRYAFDNVKDLAKGLDILESTIHSADLSSENEQKTWFDIFFVVDVSGSLGNENFVKTFDFVTTFIQRVSGTKAVVRFGCIAFGSYPSNITEIKEELTPEIVIERIKGVQYRDYYNNRGRRVGAALEIVYSAINETLQTRRRQPLPKQVIFIITNGPYNGAPSPVVVIKKISNLLSHLPNSLDIYAIGIGEVQKNYLESLIPMKETLVHDQRYAFYLPTYDYLEEAQEKPKKKDHSQTFDCGIRGNVIQRPVGRIFGGIKSKEYEWPWQVNIEFPDKEFCGGSIISTRWILSAAHCFNDSVNVKNDIAIWIGSTRRKTGLQKLSVEEIILHENFSEPTEMNNDIALLKVKETIKYSSHVRPICLPCTKRSAQLLVSPTGRWKEACRYEDIILTSDNGRNEKILSGYVTGWGYYKKKSTVSSFNLLHAQVYIQNRLMCASEYPLTETMFCAKGTNADSCKGRHHQFWKNEDLRRKHHGILQ
ncbi:complement factor B-like isoform X2 [Pristis pectinata]|uniref:complement factor B-like isoform X2 n=1 Tax=Pristis pectinata TaxID=685728 RepID=UPI00223D3E36|nr:complement factor B-like isoform X2 [Pristis pectinata]